MHEVVQHLVLLVAGIGFCAIGWFMAHNSGRVYRFFTLGGTGLGEVFAIRFLKVVGWCFTVAFAAGAVMQLVLILLALLR
ncbi:MAG TPA: hypothetical protein VF753_13070 [Terriglobales bacterium]